MEQTATELASSLERIVPDQIEEDSTTGLQTLHLHQARYEFAAAHLRPGRVLDIACGTGYGSEILLNRCQEDIAAYVGVDISVQAIEYAQSRYAHPLATFIHQSIDDFRDGQGFQTIISLETIEHLPAPGAFVEKLVQLLQPGGVLICSAPTTPSVDVNPYHLNDFTERSYRRLFQSHGLDESDHLAQIQHYRPGAACTRSEARMKDLRPNLPGYYLTHPHRLIKRLWATVRYGFTNRYLTVAWQKPVSSP